MLHEPAAQAGTDHAAEYKKSLGVKIFIVYALIYAGFVAINVIDPMMMETEIVFGLNLAIVYGFGLIIIALILALIYNVMCGNKESELNKEAEEKEKK
jgi:uncharacterized membrane protein (DUF485 family)